MKKITAFIFILSSVNCSAQFSWQNVGSGLGTNVNHSCLTLLKDTINEVLYAGGVFKNVDTFECEGIAFWDGINWDSNVPYPNGAVGLPHIHSLGLYNGVIYGCGGTTNGSIFHISDSGLVSDCIANGLVYCFCIYHDKLYAGGEFTNIDGLSASRIACYNGVSWSSVGGGVQWTQACCSDVRAMHVWNDKLYVGGTFDKAGTLDSVNSIAVWNDTSWSNLGTGVLNYGTGLSTAYVYAIDDYKNELYIGGRINDAGGVSVNGICKWNDTLWSDVGGSIDGILPEVYCFTKMDSSLYVGGLFVSAGGGATNSPSVARWDNSTWHSVGLGLDIDVGGFFITLAVYNGELYGGGAFVGDYNGYHLVNIAKYGLINTIAEELEESEFSLYPNPATDQLTITSSKNIQSLEVTNVLGEIIFTQNYSTLKTSTEISVAELSSGIYFLRVQSKDGWSVSKFVKH